VIIYPNILVLSYRRNYECTPRTFSGEKKDIKEFILLNIEPIYG